MKLETSIKYTYTQARALAHTQMQTYKRFKSIIIAIVMHCATHCARETP